MKKNCRLGSLRVVEVGQKMACGCITEMRELELIDLANFFANDCACGSYHVLVTWLRKPFLSHTYGKELGGHSYLVSRLIIICLEERGFVQRAIEVVSYAFLQFLPSWMNRSVLVSLVFHFTHYCFTLSHSFTLSADVYFSLIKFTDKLTVDCIIT